MHGKPKTRSLQHAAGSGQRRNQRFRPTLIPAMKALITASLITFSTLGAVSAQAAGDHASHAMTPPSNASAEMQMIDARVKKIDKAAGKVTLAHGPLTNLNMPAMTMAFKVSNASWLDRMKTGDKIRFMADNVNGAITVVHFEPAK